MIEKSEAIILRAMRYGDTSKIVTAYTRDFGRASFIAKGARSRGSKFGSALEPLTHSQLVFYNKAGRDLQLLSQADAIASFRHIADDEHRLASGFTMLELVHATTQADERHEEVFILLLESLGWMNTPEIDPDGVLIHFVLRMTDLLGFGAEIDRCSHCGWRFDPSGADKRAMTLDRATGGFVCRDCSHTPTVLHPARIALLLRLRAEGPVGVAVPHDAFLPVLMLLLDYLRCHIPEMRRLKSLALLGDFS